MKVRFSSFIGTREVRKVEGGYTTRVDFELPHRMMLCNLTNEQLYNLSEQIESLFAYPEVERTLYLGQVNCIEEVSNKVELTEVKDE